MDPQISIEAEFKDGKLQTGLDRAVRAEEKMEEGLRKITREAKQSEREMDRFARRVTDLNAAPLDKYLEKQTKLNKALEAGKISQDIHAKATAYAKAEYEKLQAELDGTATRMRALAEAEADAANAAHRAAQEEQKRVKWLHDVKVASMRLEFEENLRLIKAQKEAHEQSVREQADRTRWLQRVRGNSARIEHQENLRLVREQGDKAQWLSRVKANSIRMEVQENIRLRQEQQKALGPDFLGQVKSFAAGYLTLQAAVNLVADAFRNAREESREALAGLRSLDDARRQLNQVAESPEELAAMTARADAAAAISGVSRPAAYDTLFEAKNYGIEDKYEEIMQAQQVIRPDAAIRLGGKMSTMFEGKIDPMQAINMGLVAAGKSEMNFEEFAGTMAIAGEGGRIAESSPDEMMAAVSVLSAAFKSGQVAADRVKTFTTKAGLNPQLAGKGLLGSLDAIHGMTPEARAEFLKTDMELNAAYQSLSQFEGAIRGRQSELIAARRATGTAASPLSLGVSRAGANPEMRASVEAAKAEISLELTKEQELAQGEAARVVATSGVREAAIRNGSIGRRAGARAGEYGAGFLQLPGEQAQAFSQAYAGLGEGVQIGLTGNTLTLIAKILEEIRDQQRKPNHSGIGRAARTPAQ